MDPQSSAVVDRSTLGTEPKEGLVPLMEQFIQASESLRALLPRLPPMAEGPTRIALEQIARARQL